MAIDKIDLENVDLVKVVDGLSYGLILYEKDTYGGDPSPYLFEDIELEEDEDYDDDDNEVTIYYITDVQGGIHYLRDLFFNKLDAIDKDKLKDKKKRLENQVKNINKEIKELKLMLET